MPSLIGNKPNQVPSNGDLGTLAFQDASNVLVGNLNATGVTTVQAGTVSAPAITTTGDTNTGIFFPAADTIAFTEGGVESMRIDSSGNLLVGVTSASGRLEVGGITGSSGFSFLLGNGANGDNYYTSGSSGIQVFRTGATERMRIDSSGNVLVGITSARANAGDVQVSKGISFPATQSASSDANTLDDYEEGTFNFTLGGSGGESGQSYTTRQGRYTKIGRQVTITAYVELASGGTGTVTGDAQLKGLPFVPADSVTAQIYWNRTNSVNFVEVYLYAYNSATMSFRGNTAASTGNATAITAANLYGNQFQILFSCVYDV
jgi:hypothetical protein